MSLKSRRGGVGVAALILAALITIGSRPAIAAPTSFLVTGAVAKPTTWTTAQLGRTFVGQVRTISYTLKGALHTAHAIPLVAVVGWSQPRVNSHIKHHALQFVVEVAGSDGYAVDFSLAELMPDIGDRTVYVALDQDGKPLPSDEGPVEIVSPSDRKPARWVHGVATITLVDMAAVH